MKLNKYTIHAMYSSTYYFPQGKDYNRCIGTCYYRDGTKKESVTEVLLKGYVPELMSEKVYLNCKLV